MATGLGPDCESGQQDDRLGSSGFRSHVLGGLQCRAGRRKRDRTGGARSEVCDVLPCCVFDLVTRS